MRCRAWAGTTTTTARSGTSVPGRPRRSAATPCSWSGPTSRTTASDRLTDLVAVARSEGSIQVARIGTSFSPHRAAFLGVDPRVTFEKLLALGFALIRVSAYWDEIRSKGYGDLDWILDAAQAAGQPILLTV